MNMNMNMNQMPMNQNMMNNQMQGMGGMNMNNMNNMNNQNMQMGMNQQMAGMQNMNNMSNMNNMNTQQVPGKMNIVFKATSGAIKNIQTDLGTTIGQLLVLYLRRMDRENLIGNDKDICFLYDATRLKYDDNRKVEQVFRFINPCVMVNDTKNLIGAN